MFLFVPGKNVYVVVMITFMGNLYRKLYVLLKTIFTAFLLISLHLHYLYSVSNC